MGYSRKNFKSQLFAGLVILLASNAPVISEQIAITSSDKFRLELTPGKYYQSSTQWLLFKIKIYPQVAVWVESEDGKYIGTFYVTKKGGQNKWVSAPGEGRPEALPVWNHLKKGGIDGVTSATSNAAMVKSCALDIPLPPGRYIVKLETNRSYDYNTHYTKTNSGVTGQPSLIYQAVLTIGNDPCSALFTPIGTGSIDGSDGKIRAGLDGIDTALELFTMMSISYQK